MTALCKAYDNTTDAERAVADLLAAGVPGDDVRLLMGAEIHDARREARGRFSGSVAPEDHVAPSPATAPSAALSAGATRRQVPRPRAASPTPSATSSSPSTRARSAHGSPAGASSRSC